MTALLVRYKIAAFTPNGYPVYHSNHLQIRNFYIFKEWKESTATTVNTWNLAVRISIIYITPIIQYHFKPSIMIVVQTFLAV